MAEKTGKNKDFLNQISVNKVSYKDVSKITADADTAISNLQQGNFDLAVKLMLDMLADSRINAVIQSRISNIFSDNLELKISNASDEVHREKLLQAVNDAELKLFWISYLILGVGICKIDWKLEDEIYIPYLKNFLPLGLRYDNLSQSYFLLVQEIQETDTEKRINEIKDLSNVTTIQQAKDQAAKFEYLKDSYDWLILSNGNQGHLFGLINALKDDYVLAESTKNDLAVFNSDNNGRILVLKTPVDSEPAARDAFAQSLTSIKKNSTVLLPQGNSEYSSFNLDTIDSSGSKVYESFLETLNLCYNNYAILVLGGNLTSSVSSGSLAASESHMTVREEIGKSDKECLYKMLNDQLVKKYSEINKQDFSGVFLYKSETDEITKQLDALSNILVVNEALKENGKEIDLDLLLDQLGISFVKQA